MGHSTIKYYLFVLLSILITSCNNITDEVIGECSKKGNTAKEDIKVKLAMYFPNSASTTRSALSEGYKNERRVNDIALFIFERDHLKEKLFKNDIIYTTTEDGVQGIIYSSLKEEYSTNIRIVTIFNAQERGINMTNLNPVKEADLYKELIYMYGDQAWNIQEEGGIPMWGVCEMPAPQPGSNQGTVEMKRAVAKINISVKADNFKLKTVRLHNFNNKGYCAPIDQEIPSIIPNSISQRDMFFDLSDTNGKQLEDEIYIPEHINNGSDTDLYFEIEGYVNNNSNTKTYSLLFKKNGTGDYYNIFRNNLYVFNIISVKAETEVSPTLKYEVELWEEKTVDIPSFN